MGDVMRAITATTMDWGASTEITGDLSGSERRVVLFGADGQRWSEVQAALRSGLVSDGDVELILERPGRESRASEWQVPHPSPTKVPSSHLGTCGGHPVALSAALGCTGL